jgi:hypothetical protein
MTKNTFVELKLNGTLIIRERSMKTMSNKLKRLQVSHLLEHPCSSLCNVITNIPKQTGNIFEATLRG